MTDCGAAECPGGGVTVHLTGTGMAGAQVIIEDQNPATMGAHGEALGAIARVTPAGDWRATLGPMHDTGTGTVRAVQRGDTLAVYQVSPPPESSPSASTYVTIPRH